MLLSRRLPQVLIAQRKKVIATHCRMLFVLRPPALFAKDGKEKGSPKIDDKGKETNAKCEKGGEQKEKKDPCEKQTAVSLTEIKGGRKCIIKKKKKPEKIQKPKKQPTCEELLAKFSGTKKSDCNPDLTLIRGGGECPKEKKKETPPTNHAQKWKRYSLFGAIPAVISLAVAIVVLHKKEDRPEYIPYTYKYLQNKAWFVRDGRRTPLHNGEVNALPQGYEDEIDEEGLDIPMETDKAKAERLKVVDNLRKEWKKEIGKREKEAAKAEKEAAKEAERAEKEAQKEAAKAEKEAAKAEKEAAKAEKEAAKAETESAKAEKEAAKTEKGAAKG